jgi:Carboxypeptidase regulatory-like domain
MSRRDAEKQAAQSIGALARARWRTKAGRFASPFVIGCLTLFALAPGAFAAGTGKIEGTVTESAHKALAGVSVTVYGPGKELQGSASTNSSGEYTVSGLSEGEYTVEFKALGDATQYYDKEFSIEEADPVFVSEGAAKMGIDAEMLEPGKIAGIVTNSAHAPLEGVDVQAASVSRGFVVNAGFTDANGEYVVEDLPPGEYEVAFLPSGNEYITQFYNGQNSSASANPVLVAAGKTTFSINAALIATGKITGTVTDAYTHAGLDKIAVYASGEFGFGFASTASNGEYTITGLPSGSYKVQFFWEFSKDERKACEHTPRCPPKYITQFFNDQPSEVTANPVGITVGAVAGGINAAMVPSGPFNTVGPSISGKASVGSLLTCASGSWTGEPELALAVGWPLPGTFSYQWLRDGAPIAGATTDAYIGLPTDVGHALVCEVTATNGAGRASARSSALAITKPVPLVETTASKLVVSKGATKVKVSCASASCVGSAEVKISVKHGKGRKSKRITVVLAKGPYSLAVGKTGTVTLRLSASGKKQLAQAHHHRMSAKLVVTVTGGKKIEKTVLISS